MENHRTIIMRLVIFLLVAELSTSLCYAQRGKDTLLVRNAQMAVDMALKDSISWAEAKAEIEKGLAPYPDNAELNYLMGRYYYAQNGLKKARYRFVRAIQLNDDHYKARRMMLDVETRLKQYSSAICYANELLEAQPYDSAIWMSKIHLYRKLNNFAEADATLERMGHIFTNDLWIDTLISKRRYQHWNEFEKRDSLSEIAVDLEMAIRKDTLNVDNYRELSDIYSAMGEYDKSVATAIRGLKFAKGKDSNRDYLAKKAIGLMVGRGQYGQALGLVKEKNLGLDSYYSDFLEYAAEDARIHDPYEANARAYERTKDHNILTYLVNTSISRGYYDDALGYLKKKWGNQEDSLWKHRYALEVRMGHERAANNALTEYYQRCPDDALFTDDFIYLKLNQANGKMVERQWEGARADLCAVIDTLRLIKKDSLGQDPLPEYLNTAIPRQLTTLSHLGRYREAGNLWKMVNERYQGQMADAIKEVATKQLQDLIAEEKYKQARALSDSVLKAVCDNSFDSTFALPQRINIALAMRDSTTFWELSEKGYMTNRDEPYYIVRYATALQQQKRYIESINTLSGKLHMGYEPLLSSALSGITTEWANDTLKGMQRNRESMTIREYEDANNLVIALADSALLYDADNKELRYLRGVAYEHLKNWGKAFTDQVKNYEPGNAEQREYYQHRDYLEWRTLKERIDISYTHALYDTRQDDLASTAHLYSIASVAYSHLDSMNTYTAQVSYKGIDGYHDGHENEAGGTGLELMAQWEHQFDLRWSGTVSGSYSTKFFNKWGANVAISYAADKGWTPSLRLGYRRTPETYLFLSANNAADMTHEKYHLFMTSPSIEKSWERIRVSVTTDVTVLKSSLYYNIGAKGKLFFNEDNISSVSLLAGFGSFPELSFFEQTALRNVSHTNTMIGFDAQWLCSPRLSIGLSGSWNTCYDPFRNADGSLSDSYRNIYSVCAQLHVAF